MKTTLKAALCGVALVAAPSIAQDNDYGQGNEVVVTGSRISRNSLSSGPIGIGGLVPPSPPVIGFKRQADSAVRNIEIVSDSREPAMRLREVQAMLLDAIDRAKTAGFSLVTGRMELVEVTRANWQDQFPELAGKAKPDDDEDEDFGDDEDDNQQGYQDDGGTTVIRLKVKTKLDGSINNAQQKITGFIKSVPATGRSLMVPKGGLALTIINPDQYRDEIYKRISTGAKHAVSFYGSEYSVEVTGLDRFVDWQQVSNTEVFLYIPYSFKIEK